jgi:peptidoglycan/LPS O-acetylase OafA/YrhL
VTIERPHQRTGDARPTTRFYRPELDVLRLMSFLLVFAHHALPRNPNWIADEVAPATRYLIAAASNICGFGLCLFFFLSALLITELLLRERACSGKVHIGLFYQRRMLRIWPLYYFAIAIGVIWAAVGPGPGGVSVFGYYLAMVGNWYVGNHGWLDNPMTPLWSISIEEQFYLLGPLIIAVCSRRQLYVVTAVIAVTALAVAHHLGSIHADLDYGVWTNSFVQFLMFAAGMFVAVVLDGRLPVWSAPRRALLCIGGVTAWFVAVVYFGCKLPMAASSGVSVAAGYALIAIGCTAIFLSLYGIQRVPSLLVRLGRISFGLYVYHLLSIKLVQLAVPALPPVAQYGLALTLTVVLAALSYRLIEMPFLRLKQRRAVIRTDAPATLDGPDLGVAPTPVLARMHPAK